MIDRRFVYSLFFNGSYTRWIHNMNPMALWKQSIWHARLNKKLKKEFVNLDQLIRNVIPYNYI